MSVDEPNGLRYFPLTKPVFEHQFGVRAIGEDDSIVEATDHYIAEIKLKRDLLTRHPDDYFRVLPGSADAQREAMQLIQKSAAWIHGGRNTLLNEAVDEDGDIAAPLLSIARHVQEDVAIIDGDPKTGHALMAGCVTFPSGWSVADKIGQSLLSIHAPVPEYDAALHPPTEKLMTRLKAGRPVWRMNWGVRASGQLDQSPVHLPAIDRRRESITPANAGEQAYFRVERQTLARLPVSQHILFAIHTHQCTLRELSVDQRRNLLGVLKTCPHQTLEYKGILPMRDALLEYLSV